MILNPGVFAGEGGGIPIVEAYSEDGVAYTATVPGVTEYKKGFCLAFCPRRTNSDNPKLNINGIGEKRILVPFINYGAVDAPRRGMFDTNIGYLVIYSANEYFILLGYPSGNVSGLGGTFSKMIYAGQQNYNNNCLRNSLISPGETTPTVNGEINWTYG